MDVREAISAAKSGLIEFFLDEQINNLGLEEVIPESGGWNITLGFSRPWDTKRNTLGVLGGTDVAYDREYKVVHIDNLGKVSYIRNRD